MAAGVITIAHNSGGPKEDIVVPFQGKTTGFLASSPQEYAEHIYSILSMSDEARKEMQMAARDSTSRFSDEIFDEKFKYAIRKILPS